LHRAIRLDGRIGVANSQVRRFRPLLFQNSDLPELQIAAILFRGGRLLAPHEADEVSRQRLAVTHISCRTREAQVALI
jgi:hypothetical protein